MRFEKEIISITNKTEMKQKKSTRELKKKSVIFKVETVLFVFFFMNLFVSICLRVEK